MGSHVTRSIRLNLGGEGEATGFVDMTLLERATRPIALMRRMNATGHLVLARAQEIPLRDASVEAIVAHRFPVPALGDRGIEQIDVVMRTDVVLPAERIASEIARVLAPHGTAIFEVNADAFAPGQGFAAVFERYGFIVVNPRGILLRR